LFKPTKDQIQAAYGRTVPDVIAPGLKVLFCGINPGLYSGAVGHHFARPGNRFWKALHLAGFTPRLLSAFEERELLAWGCGITNLVGRATAVASEIPRAELIAGVGVLEAKAQQFRPLCVAVLGLGAYRIAFGRPDAGIGAQTQSLGPSRLWVLPNPSGLNAHFQLAQLADLFAELRAAAETFLTSGCPG
jgi:TDG/mug DNA glycosylase family protein